MYAKYMNKTVKTENSIYIRNMVFASIATSLLMIGSFSFIYLNMLQPNTSESISCQQSNHSHSADGLVVANEADLRCAGGYEAQKSFEETVEIVSLSVAVLSSVSNVSLLLILLRRVIRN